MRLARRLRRLPEPDRRVRVCPRILHEMPGGHIHCAKSCTSLQNFQSFRQFALAISSFSALQGTSPAGICSSQSTCRGALMTAKPTVYSVPRVQGSLIRAARKARGLSQEQLAEMVVVDPSKIGRIERSQGLSDHYVPDVWTIEKIAEILNVPPINFYDAAEIEQFMSGKISSPFIQDDEDRKSSRDKHHEAESLTPELFKIIETIPKSLDRKQFKFSFRSPKRWWPVQPTVSELFKYDLESGNCVSDTASIYSEIFHKTQCNGLVRQRRARLTSLGNSRVV